MVQALLFDVFGTVVDWRSGVAREVETFFAGSGRSVDAWAFADSWRAKYQPSMEEVRSGRRGYVVLDVLHRENLDATLAEFDLAGTVDDEGRARLNRAWEKLPPWPDVLPGLEALHGRYLLAPCSNGSIAMMARLARNVGLPWDAIVGADIGRGYKPQREVYSASAAALGLAPAEVRMVAAHNFDLAAARKAGLKAAFVSRPDEYGDGPVGTPDLEPSDDWEAVVPDFMALARHLGAAG